MKEVNLPEDAITLTDHQLKIDKTHNALDLIEDVIMARHGWRAGDGPKHASIVFIALDKARESGKMKLRLADTTYTYMLEQVALDPGTIITPRAANRLYLKVARAFNEAEEVEEAGSAVAGNGSTKKPTIAKHP
jgi:hypothetical protein